MSDPRGAPFSRLRISRSAYAIFVVVVIFRVSLSSAEGVGYTGPFVPFLESKRVSAHRVEPTSEPKLCASRFSLLRSSVVVQSLPPQIDSPLPWSLRGGTKV